MSVHHGLGKGLDTLLKSNTAAESSRASGQVRTLPIFKLTPGTVQPRQVFDEAALDELAASIKAQGIIQPLLVRPLNDPGENYEIVAGERRWRAAKKAGLTQVPVIVRELSDNDALAIALVENLQREDLNPIEEARAIATLRSKLNLSQDEVASKIGKSRSAVANALRLLQLPEKILEALDMGDITAGHARALLALGEDAEAQQILFAAILEKGLSVRAVESALAGYKRDGTFSSSFLTADAERKNGPRPVKPLLLKDIQTRLRSRFQTKITVSGTESMGRMTIPYESAEALKELLALLGCTNQDGEASSDTQEPAAGV